MTPLTCATLELNLDGIPYSSRFDDIYHSRGGGLAQAREVFMAGNRLPHAWRGREHFTILETGFGQGLSFLATWQAWLEDQDRCRRLHFVSVEQFPFTRQDLTRLHAQYPEVAELGNALREAWPWLTEGVHRLELAGGAVILTLVLGEATKWLPELQLSADAIYLDGFAPDKNPELWSDPVYRQLRRLAHEHTTLATYTVAGHVRRGLSDAGFLVERVQGFAGKRQMLQGVSKPGPQWKPPLPPAAERSAIVIGAGMAGASAAWQLARRGWKVTVLESQSQIASGASGNHVGLMHATFSRDDNLQARLSRAGCAQTLQALRLFEKEGLRIPHGRPGQLQLAKTAEQEALFAHIVSTLGLPPELVRFIDRETGTTMAQHEVAAGGLHYAASAWIHPPGLCRALLSHTNITVRTGCEVSSLARDDSQWQLKNTTGETIACSGTVVLANATAAAKLWPDAALPLSDSLRVVTRIAEAHLPEPGFSISGPSYLTAAHEGLRCVGAAEVRNGDPMAAAKKNLQEIRKLLPAIGLTDDQIHDWRICARPTSSDRLPLVGALPATQRENGSVHQLWQIARAPGLFGVLGFGSRGLTWAILAGDLLASQLNGEPLPLEKKLVDAIDPGRFILRELRKNQGVSS